jgi:hypothetical protein
MKIEGQWFGTFQLGNETGTMVVNLDQRRNGYSGTAGVLERPQRPGEIHAIVLQPDDSGPGVLKGHTDLRSYYVMPDGIFRHVPPQEIHQLFPDLTPQAAHAQISGRVTGDVLSISISAPAGAGSASCRRVAVPDKSAVPAQRLTWDEFKTMVTAQAGSGIYRGQGWPWPVRTAFHRAGRFDVGRFGVEDIVRLESAVMSATDTTFDLRDNRHLGALLGIAQHHGFPTPLLDWTKSPYVAAYFACHEALRLKEHEPTVFRFNRDEWRSQQFDIGQPVPIIGFIEPIPLKNNRLLPQQSVLVYCNVDGFEEFVKGRERAERASYLTRYTLTDAPGVVLRDLRLMGVYAASLFPGLDGMCRGVFEESVELLR